MAGPITTPSQLDSVDPQEVDQVAQELAGSPTTNPDAFTYQRPDGATVGPGDDETQRPSTPFSPAETGALKSVADGSSSSKSSRGLTDDGLARVKRGVQDPMQAQIDAETGQLQRQHDADVGTMQADADAEKQNLLEHGELEKRHQEEVSGLLQRHQDMVQTWSELDRQFQAQSAQQQAQYLNAYEKQLAAARAIQVRSPYGGLGKIEAAGVSGAAFAQGFLAARYGIHIDAISQIDKWVDSSIKEQERNKQNALDSANDQLNLWHLAKETSNSEWEARQRYRGLVLQGMQISIQQEAARFGGDLAASDAAGHAIHLQSEIDSTKRAMGEQFYKDVHQVKTDARDQAYKMGLLSIQQASEAETRRHNMALEKATAPQPTAPPQDLVVSDPEPVMDDKGQPVKDENGNAIVRNVARVKRGLDPEITRQAYKDAEEARTQYEQYYTATNKMMSSYQDAKAVRDAASPFIRDAGWDVLARADKTGAVQRFLQDRNAWVQAKVYNDSGKAVNADEFKRHEAQVYIDKVFAENGEKAEQSFAQLRTAGRQKFESHFHRDEFEPIAPQDTGNVISRKGSASPMSAAQDDAELNGKEQSKGLVATELSEVPAKDSEEIATKKVSGAWADYQRSQPSDEGSDVKLGQPHYAVALDTIAAAYVDPEQTAKVLSAHLKVTKKETPEEMRQAAYDALRSASSGQGGKYPPDARAYAHHLYMQLPEPSEFETDPAGAQAKMDKLRERLTWRPGTKE